MPVGLMVALDMNEDRVAVELAGDIGSMVSALKVGPQLFTRYGPGIVERILGRGARVFLDLKFHDIPNTVAKAVEGVSGLGVSWFTVHASGGADMIAAAREAAGEAKVLAVTVLTSLKEEDAHRIGFTRPLALQVSELAVLAREAGADGIVCSPLEIETVRAAVDDECIIVTPGIRPAGASQDDQARTATPARAVASGADYLVVGRPVVQAANRKAAVKAILEEMESGAMSS